MQKTRITKDMIYKSMMESGILLPKMTSTICNMSYLIRVKKTWNTALINLKLSQNQRFVIIHRKRWFCSKSFLRNFRKKEIIEQSLTMKNIYQTLIGAWFLYFYWIRCMRYLNLHIFLKKDRKEGEELDTI